MRRFGYGKIGRSMPLTLDACGSTGGDVEMVAVVKTLALRHPEDEFWLVGRNTNEHPADVGLPPNVVNPWSHPYHRWADRLREGRRAAGLTGSGSWTLEQHLALRDLYDDITLPTLRALDGFVLWAGQHAQTNGPLPSLARPGQTVRPPSWGANYASFLARGVNAWRDGSSLADPLAREEVWLNADPRNYLKLRDLKWPLRHPVLTQYTFDHRVKHHRYGDFVGVPSSWATAEVQALGDGETWESTVRNVYSRLEINGLLPGTPFGDLLAYDENPERGHLGLFMNEAKRDVRPELARVNLLDEWILPLVPAWVHGRWSAPSQQKLIDRPPWLRPIEPAPWARYVPLLHSVRCTVTTPSSGSGWATAKPWEAFAAGTVCFFLPGYDDQNNVLGDAPSWLQSYLRVSTPEQLADRIHHMTTSDADWLTVVRAQREHFDRAVGELTYLKLIEQRLYGGEAP